MNLTDRITAFQKLGNYINSIDSVSLSGIIEKVRNENPWFTEDNVKLSLEGIAKYLNNQNLTKWVSAYHLNPALPKKVGVVMAGNIPLVGFHDFLSVLISGHRIIIKPSTKDRILLTL